MQIEVGNACLKCVVGKFFFAARLLLKRTEPQKGKALFTKRKALFGLFSLSDDIHVSCQAEPVECLVHPALLVKGRAGKDYTKWQLLKDTCVICESTPCFYPGRSLHYRERGREQECVLGFQTVIPNTTPWTKDKRRFGMNAGRKRLGCAIWVFLLSCCMVNYVSFHKQSNC